MLGWTAPSTPKLAAPLRHLVRRIFEGFVETQSGTKLVQALRAEGATTKRGLALSDTDNSEEWLSFALVARGLASGERLSDPALFDAIAETTVDVFAASTPRRRQAGRTGR